MNRTRRILCASILLLLAAAGPALALSYEEALALAMEKDFGILIAKEAAAEARVNDGLAKSGFLPTVDLNASVQRIDGETDSNAGDSTGVMYHSESDTDMLSAGASLNWTLFDGLGMFSDRDYYHQLAELGETRARAQVESRITEIHRAYFHLVQSELLMEVKDENRALSADRLEREGLRRDLGALSRAQFLSAQTAYNNDLASYLKQEIALGEARRELRLMLGLDPGAALTVVPEIILPELTDDLEALLATARRSNSSLAAAGLEEALAGSTLGGAKAAHWPSLNFGLGWQWSDRSAAGDPVFTPDPVDSESRDLTLSLSLNYRLFDGDRNRLRVQSSRAALRQSELAHVEADRTLASELALALATLERRLALVELEADNVAATAVRLELEAERYEAGAATSLDYRDAQLALTSARGAEISARFQARLARHEIDRLVGSLPTR